MYKNSLLQNILDPTGRRLHPVWCGCSLSWHWCPPPPSSWPPRPFQQLVYQKGREVGVNLILWEMESFSLEVRDLSRMGPPTKWQRFETSTVGKGKDFFFGQGLDCVCHHCCMIFTFDIWYARDGSHQHYRYSSFWTQKVPSRILLFKQSTKNVKWDFLPISQ